MADTLEIVKSEIGRLLGLDGHSDPTSSTGVYSPFLTGDGMRGMRLYKPGQSFKKGCDYKLSAIPFYNTIEDDFNGAAVDTFKWNSVKGSDAATAVAILAATNNGILRLTTGAGSTHTMAVNGAQITSGRNLLISDSGTRFETRLGKISALTSQSICFGLADATTLNAPFTRTTATTTANATNAACFLQDAASTNTHLYAVAVNAGGAAQSVALNVDVDTAAHHVYRIEIDSAGNALFYIDGALVATIALAVATTAVLCPSVGMFSEVTTGSQTLDIDYVMAQQVRT